MSGLVGRVPPVAGIVYDDTLEGGRRGMVGGQGLLRDIIDHPGDDGLRRIYADWLDDDGQHDRAEFLRAQLDLAAMDDG
ncbi:MAG: TIGR02996 domain-containing protein, partial [Gemmataceae bacterium]